MNGRMATAQVGPKNGPPVLSRGVPTGKVLFTPWYDCIATPICRSLFEQAVRRALARAAWTAGRSSAIRIPIMAMTTSSSTSVNAQDLRGEGIDDHPGDAFGAHHLVPPHTMNRSD